MLTVLQLHSEHGLLIMLPCAMCRYAMEVCLCQDMSDQASLGISEEQYHEQKLGASALHRSIHGKWVMLALIKLHDQMDGSQRSSSDPGKRSYFAHKQPGCI